MTFFSKITAWACLLMLVSTQVFATRTPVEGVNGKTYWSDSDGMYSAQNGGTKLTDKPLELPDKGDGLSSFDKEFADETDGAMGDGATEDAVEVDNAGNGANERNADVKAKQDAETAALEGSKPPPVTIAACTATQEAQLKKHYASALLGGAMSAGITAGASVVMGKQLDWKPIAIGFVSGYILDLGAYIFVVHRPCLAKCKIPDVAPNTMNTHPAALEACERKRQSFIWWKISTSVAAGVASSMFAKGKEKSKKDKKKRVATGSGSGRDSSSASTPSGSGSQSSLRGETTGGSASDKWQDEQWAAPGSSRAQSALTKESAKYGISPAKLSSDISKFGIDQALKKNIGPREMAHYWSRPEVPAKLKKTMLDKIKKGEITGVIPPSAFKAEADRMMTTPEGKKYKTWAQAHAKDNLLKIKPIVDREAKKFQSQFAMARAQQPSPKQNGSFEESTPTTSLISTQENSRAEKMDRKPASLETQDKHQSEREFQSSENLFRRVSRRITMILGQ